MAHLDDILTQIDDPTLRAEIAAEVRQLRERLTFGLVFERHLPESVLLANDAGLAVGDRARFRKHPSEKKTWLVVARHGDTVSLRDGDGQEEEAAVCDLLVVKNFNEPVYPTLRPVGSVRRGGKKRPHLVIEGENFHALELLRVSHRGRFDCIYIDPPYNTGARDWKYNNDFVDDNDTYRHSKWLSFMEKRLRIAKDLLRADSVLVVTIDEKEFLHLGMLLEELFPECRIQMVSSLINPATVARKGGFGRNDEYIFFVMKGEAAPQKVRLGRDWVSSRGRTFGGSIRWDLLRRSGSKTHGELIVQICSIRFMST